VAKGKKEDPNKVAQRKAQRVAFVQSRPDLAPEVARKRFYVQTRAQELEAAGKPVDRAALRQKFETGGVTREGFYTPADIARINARKNVNNGTGSLADTKTTTTSTSSTPVKNPPVSGVVGAPTAPPSTTKTPTKSKPQSRPPDRIQDTVIVAGATQKSPDVMEARKRASKKDITDNAVVKKAAGFFEGVGRFTVGGIESGIASFINPFRNAANNFDASLQDFKADPSLKTFIFGGERREASRENPQFRKASTTEDVLNSLVALPPGTGRAVAGGLAKGLGKVGAKSASGYINALLKVTSPGYGEMLAINPRRELPAAGQTGKFGNALRAEETRLADMGTSRGWGAGETPMPELGSIPPSELTSQQRATIAKKMKEARVGKSDAPSLAEVKQAEIDAQIEAGIKAATEKPVAEAPTVEIKTKGKGGKGSKGKTKSTVEPAPVETTATKGKGGKGNKGKGKQTVAEEPMPDFGEMEGIVRFADDLASGQSTPPTRTRDFDFGDEYGGKIEFDASTMEMGSTERAMGDAYLYDPKADLGNLADIKAETKINYADIKAKTETPAVEVKGKGKGNKGGKGKNKSTVEPKPAETVATEPEPKPVKKKTTVELATQPRGRQSIAPSIELKQGTKPGHVMGQANTRNVPVQGELSAAESLPRGPLGNKKTFTQQIRTSVGSGTKADPFRSEVRTVVFETSTSAEGKTVTRAVGELKHGTSSIEIPSPKPESQQPLRGSREERWRMENITRAIEKELKTSSPKDTGVPQGEPSSAIGRFDAMTQAQQTQKGGFWSHEKNRPFTPGELSAQADLEIAANAPNKAPSLADFKTSEQQLKDVKKYLIRNKAKGTLSPKGQAMLEKVGQNLFEMQNSPRMTAGSPQADRVRSYLLGRQRRGTLGEGPLKGILESLNENLTRTVPGETVGKPKADLFARAQGMKDLSPKTKTPEMYLRAEKKHFADIRDLEIKLNDGSITRQQAQQLIQSYRSMWRASITQGQEAMWRTKVDALEERMTSFPVAPRGEQIKVKGKKGKNK